MQVPAGEAFTALQRQEITKAIGDADRVSGYAFSVYVGACDPDARRNAEALHAELGAPADSILVQVDPAARTIEIVTGARIRSHLDNRQVALAALTMQSAFATGDLTRGLVAGLQQLAGLARKPTLLHTDTP
ncbi:MAG: DUF5130 family protein [Nocardioidaceae bacterium]